MSPQRLNPYRWVISEETPGVGSQELATGKADTRQKARECVAAKLLGFSAKAGTNGAADRRELISGWVNTDYPAIRVGIPSGVTLFATIEQI